MLDTPSDAENSFSNLSLVVSTNSQRCGKGVDEITAMISNNSSSSNAAWVVNNTPISVLA